MSDQAPRAARRPFVYSAHGVSRVDDYAWLAVAEDPDVLAYLSAERAHYDAATAHLSSLRLSLADELIGRTPPSERSVSWRRGGHVYYTVTAEGEEYERIYRHDINSEQEVQLILDPNALSHDDYLEIGLVEPSPDGRLLAYSVDLTGDELYELRFRDLATGEDLPDRVPGTYYTGAWAADSGSFLYTVVDGTYRPDRVRRHTLGAGSVEVLHEPDRRFELELSTTRDGRWIVILAGNRDTTEVHLVAADSPGDAPHLVAPRRPGIEYFVEALPGGFEGSGNDELLLVTNSGDTEYRLMTTLVAEPSPWKAFRSFPGERVEFAAAFASHVVVGVRGDAEPFLRVLPRDGSAPYEIRCSVPFGQIRLWRAYDYFTDTITVVEENLVSPPAWFSVSLATGERTLLARTPVPGVDLSRYAVSRIEAPSSDGAMVPVTIAHTLDDAPHLPRGTLLYGYGAYEACEWPAFDVGVLSLLDRGVVYAVAHVRGGGERGRQWWLDGRLRSKQNTFTDFIAARDALVSSGWASSVVSRGLSAGGLLQGAVFSQAPSKWAGVVAEVPFVDVVTTMSDPSIPLTVNEWDEWGNPSDRSDFEAMLAYSPYDNVPTGPRPPLLVTGARHDPRVLVHEPAKWVAKLRATSDSPVLFRVELGAGAHVGPSGRFAHLTYEAEILAWVLSTFPLPE